MACEGLEATKQDFAFSVFERVFEEFGGIQIERIKPGHPEQNGRHERMHLHLSQVFAGTDVGLKECDDGIWLVSFMDYDLGYFDHEGMRFEPLPNPFGHSAV